VEGQPVRGQGQALKGTLGQVGKSKTDTILNFKIQAPLSRFFVLFPNFGQIPLSPLLLLFALFLCHHFFIA